MSVRTVPGPVGVAITRISSLRHTLSARRYPFGNIFQKSFLAPPQLGLSTQSKRHRTRRGLYFGKLWGYVRVELSGLELVWDDA